MGNHHSKSSKLLFERAKLSIPGGVNSPVRAFKAVGGTPLFIKSAKGAFITDSEGKSYIDYIQSWGPMIMGHAHKDIINAVKNKTLDGFSYGAPTEIEIELAEKIKSFIPSIEMIRMVNSGTEATMSAIRLARGYTKRDKIIKFEGCYHGHSDSLLVKAGSGALTFGVPSSPGVPADLAKHTINIPYNKIDPLEEIFEKYGNEIACVIVEPVTGNMNCILPISGYLEKLREICNQYDSLLIFDEVMTGFRVHPNGAQGYFNVKPDLTTLGKVIGGGLPVGAFGGKKEIMQELAPDGPIYQAGTLSGNPIAMAAGLETLSLIEKENIYPSLFGHTERLTKELSEIAKKYNIPFSTNHLGSMFGYFFTDKPKVTLYDEVINSNVERFNKFFHGMLSEGIYLAPAVYEANFVSAMHDKSIIDKTIQSAEKVFKKL